MSKREGVSVILCTAHPGTLKRSFDNFLRQTYAEKELIIILNSDQLNYNQYANRAKDYQNIQVHQLNSETTLGECFEFGSHLAKYKYIAKFDDDDYYCKDYLTHALDFFQKQKCDVLGKATYFVYFSHSQRLTLCGEGRENTEVRHVADSTLIFSDQILQQLDIPSIPKAGTFTEVQRQILAKGFTLYSSDRYDYAVIRNPNPQVQHTWQVTEKEFLNYPSVELVQEQVTDLLPYIESDSS